jgi:hypothetical protein
LKDDYQPQVREQLNNSFMLLDQVEKNTEDTVGTAAVLSAHVKRSSGVGPRPEGGTLPVAGNQTHTTERVSLKYNYGVIKVTGQTIKLMASDKGAFVRAVDNETKGIVRDLKRNVNIQCYTAVTGSIGTTTGSAGATSVAVNAKSTLRRIEPGQKYDIVEAASDLIVRTVTAVSVTLSSLTFTYTTDSVGTGTAASGNRIVTQGVVPSGSYELTGLESIVASSGTLHNIDPTAFAVWASYQAAISAALTDSVLEEALDEIAIAGSSNPNLIIATHLIVRNYANSLKTLKRFQGESLVLKGGWKAVDVSVGNHTVALTPERDCTESTVFILTTENLIEFYASDWEWMEEDGAVLSRVSGTDSYEAVLFKYHELCTDKRNAHGKLTSVS